MATRSPLRALFDGDGLPPADDLPRYVAPLPRWLENFGLHLAALVALTNLVGTAFGFWYYGFQPIPDPATPITGQLSAEPLLVWPLVPDSPVATLFIGLSLGLWWLGRSNEYVNALAFFGCLKLGLWTPYVLAAFSDGFLAVTPRPMYAFLFGSHLLMAVEAFLLHRISGFPVRAVFVAVVWYGLNDLVDYFLPVIGTPHHTLIPGQAYDAALGGYTHPAAIHYPAAAGAVTLTVAATFLALATRVEKLEPDGGRGAVGDGESN